MKEYFATHREQIVQDYCAFLRFPSISADPAHRDDLLACLAWLKNYVQAMGFTVEEWPTSTYPTLFASYCKKPKAKTLLLYHHYDVQPVDPLDEWECDPFSPTVKGDVVTARGAQDNKGQCFYTLTALRALLDKHGELPINVKLCIEGDEEVGSKGLMEIASLKAKELQADYLLVVDVGIKDLSSPAIVLGTRGLVTMEVKLTTAHSDLHSGEHGGIALNAVRELASLLHKLHDEESGRVMVPGFYDDVIDLSEEERKEIDFSFDAKQYERMFGALPIGGEHNYTPLESAWIRPTLEINGCAGGYYGPGFKTVLPKEAHAKLSCRLVEGQDPRKIALLVTEFLQQQARKGTKLHLEIKSGGASIRANPHSPFAQALKRAYSEVFAKPCSMIFAGGSIAVAPLLAEASNASILFCGLGLPDDAIHAPNEHFTFTRLQQGSAIIARLIYLLSL